jgi:hypothetical protein
MYFTYFLVISIFFSEFCLVFKQYPHFSARLGLVARATALRRLFCPAAALLVNESQFVDKLLRSIFTIFLIFFVDPLRILCYCIFTGW